MLQNFAKKDAIKEILRHLLGAEPSLILRTELDTSSQREGEPSGEWAGRLLDLQQLLHLADHPLYRAPSDEDIRDRFLFCSSTRLWLNHQTAVQVAKPSVFIICFKKGSASRAAI